MSEHERARRPERLGRWLLLCFLTGQPSAFAEPVRLSELERRAVERRPSVAAASSRVAAARARVGVARASLYPTLTAGVNGELAPGGRLVRIADSHGDEYLITGSRAWGDDGALTPDFRYGAQLSLSGRLLDFGRAASAVEAARAELGATTTDASSERRAIVLDVRAAYVAWLAAFVKARILTRTFEDARTLRESAEARVAEGAEPDADTTRARYDEARAELAVERGATELELARLVLERAATVSLSKSAEPDVTLLDAPLEPAPPVQSLEATALDQHRAALSASATAEHAETFPLLSARLELGAHGQAGTIFPLYRVGVSLSVPLFDGGRASASANASAAQADELAARASDARARVSSERVQSLSLIQLATRQIASAARLVAIAEQALRRAEDSRALGTGGLDAVVEARMQRARAELELLAARVERTRAVLTLSRGGN